MPFELLSLMSVVMSYDISLVTEVSQLPVSSTPGSTEAPCPLVKRK